MTAPKPKVRVLLDSGAFSAWTHGETLDVRDYIRFVKKVHPYLAGYVNLDVIPGHISRKRTREETEQSAAASYRNLQIMKDAGLRPLPVFHQGEDFKWLDKMLADGETYIGISSAKNETNETQDRWLDKFFTVVTDTTGAPLIGVHGFGSAHVDLLRRHPYFSVDSAGWRIAGAYGKIYIPRVHPDGSFNYRAAGLLIPTSGNFHESRYFQDRQTTQLGFHGPSHVDLINRFLEGEVGLNIGMVRYSDNDRILALAVYYRKVSEAMHNVRFTDRGQGFHAATEGQVQQRLRQYRPVHFKHPLFYFSTDYDAVNLRVLERAKARYHLLSYYELQKRPERLIDYAMEGRVVTTRPPRGTKPDWDSRRYRTRRSYRIAKMAWKRDQEKTNAAE